MEKATGGQPFQNPTPGAARGVERAPTLAEIGVTYDQSARYRALAAIEALAAMEKATGRVGLVAISIRCGRPTRPHLGPQWEPSEIAT